MFSKPPKSAHDKEKKAEAFINFMESPETIKKEQKRILSKEPVKLVSIRLPLSLIDDLREVSNISGISANSICIDILRPAIKKRLKDLKEEQ